MWTNPIEILVIYLTRVYNIIDYGFRGNCAETAEIGRRAAKNVTLISTIDF